MGINMKEDLLFRLEALPSLIQIPPSELEWLAKHGKFEVYQPGLVAPKGTRIETLWIILKGKLALYVDRGAGPKIANTELHRGIVTGMLPYSRLAELPGDLHTEERTEILAISVKHFPKMITQCPLFTAHTVHTMIDRTRIHTTSALQDEKMISLGKLAAGLAHELNNPASVNIRNAKLMQESLSDAASESRLLNKAGLNEKQFDEMESLLAACIKKSHSVALSPIQKFDLQDEITAWLEQNQADSTLGGPLADMAIAIEDLNNLQNTISGKILETALKWMVAYFRMHILAMEIEQASNKIYKLIDAVKKFTHMDNLAEKELIDIEAGIRDSVNLLRSKSKLKNADITLDMDKNIPRVSANGAELNQVWFSLLDNALDAIPDSGKIRIRACLEGSFITVRIMDNGAGIPQDKVDRIFDPFYTTKPPGQGTGLGLDLSRRIIRRYNGDIYVRSEPGKTEFCVNLNPEPFQ
jgi:signal transduction histidine kinase